MPLRLTWDHHQGACGPGGGVHAAHLIAYLCKGHGAYSRYVQSNSPSSTRPLNEAFWERLAAKQIGLTIPPTVLALADRVIK